jgi:hypothetical protein
MTRHNEAVSVISYRYFKDKKIIDILHSERRQRILYRALRAPDLSQACCLSRHDCLTSLAASGPNQGYTKPTRSHAGRARTSSDVRINVFMSGFTFQPHQ